MIEGDRDTAVAVVANNIIKAADISIPKSSDNPKRHCRPWWEWGLPAGQEETKKKPGISSVDTQLPQTTFFINRQEHTLEKFEENLKKTPGLIMSPALPLILAVNSYGIVLKKQWEFIQIIVSPL